MATPVMTSTDTVSFVQEIHAPIKQVYESFTNRDNASDWLGVDGEVRAVKGGFALYIISQNEHAHGTFKDVVENEKLILTWDDGTDHPVTTLKVKFAEANGTTTVTLKHSGFEDDAVVARYQKFWKLALRELQVMLETGKRAYITDRIIIGIIPTELDEETAQKLNIAAGSGVRVGGLVPDYSAALAGIQRDDVIIAVDGVALNSETTISDITGQYKPGDVVDVTYYRGAEKNTIPLALKGYPIPPVAENFPALATQFEETFAEYDAKLSAILADLSESDADKKAENAEFSIRETIAHLILSRRHNTEYLSSYVQGPRRINPYTHMPARINALVKAYPTLDELYKELQYASKEMVAVIREFPEELHNRKNNLWWINFELGYVPTGYDNAIEQINSALKA
ncbi:MAG: SRPBCC domain-containing protein [Aggregatilineales bacterium]